MFNSTVLDLVILLSFTYFIGSLLISSLQEIIATALNWRAKSLESTLSNLLFDNDWPSFLTQKVYKSPFITVLKKEEDKFPSYIPAGNFARAVIEQLGGSDIQKITSKLNSADSGLPASLKTALDDFLKQANGSIEHFQQQLETFYNTGMDRATGWYKRKTRQWIFGLSFIVALLLNLDTIKIVDDSLKQPAQLKTHADNISSAVSNIHYKQDSVVSVEFSSKPAGRITIDTNVSKVSLDTLASRIKQLRTLTSQLDSAGLSIGYASIDDAVTQWTGGHSSHGLGDQTGKVLLKLLGFFITVCAFQLGSGYWFGILVKAVNIRGTGKKPGEKQSK